MQKLEGELNPLEILDRMVLQRPFCQLLLIENLLLYLKKNIFYL